MSATHPQPPGNPPGLTVGRYRLLTKIGEGGMGVVHLAQAPDGRRVALKVLRPHIIGDDEARERLSREVSSLRLVTSPRIAEVVDADPWGETPYVATRYVPGLPLHEHVRQEGPLQGEDLRLFAAGLAEAVIAVHSVGVLHRDIKPSNVLVEGRSPVLIDFGLARLAEDPRLTVTGWLLGTPGYLAPEILYGDDATTASDVHSWAATVVFAASGEPPFGRGPAMAIMDRVRRGEHDLSAVPADLLPLVGRCLEPNPADRPDTATVLTSLTGSQGASPPAPPAAQLAQDQFTMPISLMSASRDDDPTDVIDTDAPAHPADDTPTLAQPGAVAARTAGAGAAGASAAGAAAAGAAAAGAADPTRPLTVPMAAGAIQPSRAPYMQPPPPQNLPGQAYPPQWRPLPGGVARTQRGCLLFGMSALVAAGFAMAPYVSLAVVALVALTVRTISWTTESARNRRSRRGGSRWYDGPLTVLTSPWYLFVATGGTIVLVLWSVILAMVVGLAYLLFNLPAVPGLMLMGTVIALSLWWGPGSRRLRVPTRRLVVRATGEAPTGWVWVACVGAAAGLCLVVVLANGVSWTPAPGPPWRHGTILGDVVGFL